MSFSPADLEEGEDGGALPLRPQHCAAQGRSHYMQCYPRFETNTPGPFWGETIDDPKSTVICMRSNKLYVATQCPLLVSVPGVLDPVVAFAGPRGPPIRGRWRHTRNKFSLSRYVPFEKVVYRKLPCPVFKSPHEVWLTLFGALHCDYVAIFSLRVQNTAFAGVGIVCTEGAVLIEPRMKHYSFDAARSKLASMLPLQDEFTMLDSRGRSVPPEQRTKITSRPPFSKPPPPSTACWHARWDGKIWTKHRNGAVVTGTAVTFRPNNLIVITANLNKPLPNSQDASIKAFLEERPAYNRDCALLGALLDQREFPCRIRNETTLQITIKLATLIGFQKTRDHPQITLTIGVFGADNAPRCAVGNVRIKRYWHTDLRHGTGYRVKARSAKFALLPTQSVPRGVRGIAQLCSNDTHIGSSIPPQTLGLVRAEDVPRELTGAVISEILPGEAQVLLQGVQALTGTQRKRASGPCSAVARYRKLDVPVHLSAKQPFYVTAPHDLQF
jgi:hypothetical protein